MEKGTDCRWKSRLHQIANEKEFYRVEASGREGKEKWHRGRRERLNMHCNVRRQSWEKKNDKKTGKNAKQKLILLTYKEAKNS